MIFGFLRLHLHFTLSHRDRVSRQALSILLVCVLLFACASLLRINQVHSRKNSRKNGALEVDVESCTYGSVPADLRVVTPTLCCVWLGRME